MDTFSLLPDALKRRQYMDPLSSLFEKEATLARNEQGQ